MLNAIIREKRQKKWKSAQRYRKAMERKRRLEKELGKLEERLKPDFEHNVKGILIAIHKCRGRYRPENRFEFFRKDAYSGQASDFGENDLDALIEAIQAAKLYSADAG